MKKVKIYFRAVRRGIKRKIKSWLETLKLLILAGSFLLALLIGVIGVPAFLFFLFTNPVTTIMATFLILLIVNFILQVLDARSVSKRQREIH